MAASSLRSAASGSGPEDVSGIRPGCAYTLMNCDTGRSFAPEGITDWLLESVGENAWYFRDPQSGRSLSSEDGEIRLSDLGEPFCLSPLPHHRYSLGPAGFSVLDTDEGETGCAALSVVPEVRSLSACWFVTEKGLTEPLRIMPLGDSLTLGLDADTPFREQSGYRALLSALLADSSPDLRFVFVGSRVSGGEPSAEGEALYRHEGHSGYTVSSPEDSGLSIGLYELCGPWLAKYRPVVVLLMIGTNDIGRSYGLGAEAADRTAELHLRLLERIRDSAPVRLLLLATCPPVLGEEPFNRVMERYNTLILENGQTLRESGVEVVISDVSSLISGLGPDGFCSDRMHMSRTGYDAIARLHADTLSRSSYLEETLRAIRSEREPLPEEESGPEPGTDEARTPESDASLPDTGERRILIWAAAAAAAGLAALAGVCAAARKNARRAP